MLQQARLLCCALASMPEAAAQEGDDLMDIDDQATPQQHRQSGRGGTQKASR
jgi:hypothetical protein